MSPKASLDATDKLLAYQALAEFNQAFAQILQSLHKLNELRVLRRDVWTGLRFAIEETRSWADFEATEMLHDLEQADWGRFGRLVRQWEKKYEDPNDLLLEAARQKHSPKQPARKKGKWS